MSPEEAENGEEAADRPPRSERPAGEPPPGDAPPSEEELRARIEEGLRTVRVQDVVLESAVTIVNITARRIAKEDERDLEQARVGIEAVRGLVDLLDPEPQAQVRNALSELQMIYAKASGGDETPAAAAPGSDPEDRQAEPAGKPASDPSGGQGPDPRESPPREPKKPDSGLWVPPGSA